MLPFLAALPALLSGWSGVAIGGAAAAAGAAATSQANKKAARLQYDNMRMQQNAQNAQIAQQKAYDARAANFVSAAALKNKRDIGGMSAEMQALFDASLNRADIGSQQGDIEDYTAKNEAYLQDQSGTEAVMLGGQDSAAPEVKQAISKKANSAASGMRARVAALARFGATSRDLGLENRMANADTQSKMGLIGNRMQGANRVLAQAQQYRPATAYYKAPVLKQAGNDIGMLRIGGGIASALGGYALGGAAAGLLGQGAGAAAPLVQNAGSLTGGSSTVIGGSAAANGARMFGNAALNSSLGGGLGYAPALGAGAYGNAFNAARLGGSALGGYRR